MPLRVQLVWLVVRCWLHLYFVGVGHAQEPEASNSAQPEKSPGLFASVLSQDFVKSDADFRSLVAESAIHLLKHEQDLGRCLVVVAGAEDPTGLGEDKWWLRSRLHKGGIPTVSIEEKAEEPPNFTSSCVVQIVPVDMSAMSASSTSQPDIPSNLDSTQVYIIFLDMTRLIHVRQSIDFPGYARIRSLLGLPSLKSTRQVLLLTYSSRSKDEMMLYGRCFDCSSDRPDVLHLSSWTPNKGFDKSIALVGITKRNLQGHVFKAVTMDFAPFIDYARTIDTPGGVTIPKDSMDIRILEEAARTLNFSFILREPADGQWGYLLENGSWTGTVGTIQREEADFSMMLSVTWERTYAVSFTRAYYVEPMTFVMRKPGPLPQWQAPIKPFTWIMWILLFVVVTLSGPTLWFILKLIPTNKSDVEKIQTPQDKKIVGVGSVSRQSLTSFGDICLYMIAPILAQPVSLSISSSSGRVFCGMWWFFCILTTTLYRGSLIARMTVPELSPTLDTLEQLASSNLQWGMLDTYGSGYQLFRASTVPVYMKLFEKMQYYNEGFSMQRVLSGGYAFISWKTYFRNVIARDFSDRNGVTQIHIAREEFFPGGFGWAFPKGSRYRKIFDRLFQRIIEAGLIDKWMADIIRISSSESTTPTTDPTSTETIQVEDKGQRAFTVYHLQGVFFIMLGGFIFAAMVLFLEIFLGRKDLRQAL